MINKSSAGFENQIMTMLGNEAIARGALEAGVSFAAGFPGTPSTEILESLALLSGEFGLRVEWSINEKVAFEKAMGVSLCGLRAIVSMKHAGMNWIADPLSVAVLGGVKGGVVIITADDPNCHSSANEQDNRFYGMFFRIPVLEPSDPQEAKEMTRQAFEISEKTYLPVIIRTVTRVAHTRGDVALGNIIRNRKIPSFEPGKDRFYLTTSRSLNRNFWLIEQQDNVKELLQSFNFEVLENEGQTTNIITSGVAYTYVKESINILGVEKKVGILKVGVIHPLPEHYITGVLECSDLVIVIEEGFPFLEMSIRALSSQIEHRCRIVGKMSKHIKEGGELTVEKVLRVISEQVGVSTSFQIHREPPQDLPSIIPPRTPTFCAGCPHSATFYVLAKIQKKLKKRNHTDMLIATDIGCYSMGINPPYEVGDVKYSMGAGLGVAQGLAEFLDHKIVAVIGDGTFFHAGIPGVLNALYNKNKVTILILDNGVIAMTGMQPTPSVGITATGSQGGKIPIEEVVKGCGVESMAVVDSYDIKEMEVKLLEALDYPGLSVIISRRLCAVEQRRFWNKAGKVPTPYYIDTAICNQCLICLKRFSCPAIYTEHEQPLIDKNLCIGCSVCSKVCPKEAIRLLNLEKAR